MTTLRSLRFAVLARIGAVVGIAALAAACVGSPTGPQTSLQPAQQPSQPRGEVLGAGSVPVALLLPMSAGGEASGLATAFRNAAALAMNDFPNSDVRILVRDTGGTDTGGRDAAQAAIREVVGRSAIDDVLYRGKALVAAETQRVLQAMLDSYEAGLEIDEVNLEDVQPPEAVKEAFVDVVAVRRCTCRLRNVSTDIDAVVERCRPGGPWLKLYDQRNAAPKNH